MELSPNEKKELEATRDSIIEHLATIERRFPTNCPTWVKDLRAAVARNSFEVDPGVVWLERRELAGLRAHIERLIDGPLADEELDDVVGLAFHLDDAMRARPVAGLIAVDLNPDQLQVVADSIEHRRANRQIEGSDNPLLTVLAKVCSAMGLDPAAIAEHPNH